MPDHNESSLERSCQAYLRDLEARRYSPRSITIYAQSLRDFAAFALTRGKPRARDVGKTDLTAYRLVLMDRGLRPNSVSVYMRAVRNLFRWLSDRRDLFLNPAEGMVLRQPPRPLLPVPSEEDLRRLLEAPDTDTPMGIRDRAILETLYGGGLRRAELSGLRTGDVDLGQATVRVLGKGQKERVTPVGQEAARWIGRYLQEARGALLGKHTTDALWVGRCGALSYHALAQILLEHSRRAGLPRLSPHALRRACATHMLVRGAGAIAIQHQLGHATLQHLSQYLRLSITDIRNMHATSKPGQ